MLIYRLFRLPSGIKRKQGYKWEVDNLAGSHTQLSVKSAYLNAQDILDDTINHQR